MNGDGVLNRLSKPVYVILERKGEKPCILSYIRFEVFGEPKDLRADKPGLHYPDQIQ